MIPELELYTPKSLPAVLKIIAEKKGKATLIAGGTDIVPGFHIDSKRFADIKCLIDINKVSKLKQIKESDKKISIGAAVSFTEITNNKLIKKHFPLLAHAASTVGSTQIRNRATIGGNFINNAPCADSVPSLLVYDASIKIKSAKGMRTIPLSEFLIAPYKTRLKKNEIVTEVIIPKLDKDYKGEFYKLGRRRGVAISRITIALLLKTRKNKIEDIRIASGAVTPIGKRFPNIETFAIGKDMGSDLFKELSIKLGEEVLEAAGLRWSSTYKLPVVQQMFYQLIEKISRD